MNFNGKKLSQYQNTIELNEMNEIIKYHVESIKNYIKMFKGNKYCKYNVINIPGFQQYDLEQITTKLYEFLKSDNYDCKRYDKNTIIIYWKISFKNDFKKYILHLLTIIYEKIKESIKNKEKKVMFIFPINYQFKLKDVYRNIVKILKGKEFKVIEKSQNEILICW